MADEAAVPRREAGAAGHAVVRPQVIEVVFQRYPGTAAAAAISGLNYEVVIGTNPPRPGTTGADGKVTVQLLPGASARLRVMGTEYVLTVAAGLEPVAETRGWQRRLNMLGYNVGNPDGVVGRKSERAVLNFQADNAPLKVDGLCGSQTRQRLHTVAGA
jgi:hypothetical protein